MWYSFIGASTVIIVGLIISFLTGHQDSRDLDPHLISPPIDKLVRKLFPHFRKRVGWDVGANFKVMRELVLLVQHYNLTLIAAQERGQRQSECEREIRKWIPQQWFPSRQRNQIMILTSILSFYFTISRIRPPNILLISVRIRESYNKLTGRYRHHPLVVYF